jgi:hypothetical protein
MTRSITFTVALLEPGAPVRPTSRDRQTADNPPRLEAFSLRAALERGILTKLDVRDRTEAVIRAGQPGIVS